MQLNDFDIDDFLGNYWQKKPLLIRNAITDFDNPLSANELAGLACEESVESRLISCQQGQWQLQHGPFTESTFNQLPESDWTLLVQAADHWDPAVAQLLNYFRFIPNWRIDDIMVSFATTGGSVGPHFDHYDVFLLQGAGSRQWQLGQRCNRETPLLGNQPLRLLADFQPQQKYLLNPGDMLYVPPLYSHWGIAKDNQCMTYSIGFRAPSQAELLADFCDELLSRLDEQQRYADPSPQRQANPGEINTAVIDTLQQQLIQQFSDRPQLTDWFGRYMTQPKYALDDTEQEATCSADQFSTQLAEFDPLYRDPASRFAFSQQAGQLRLYVNGDSYPCSTDSCQQLAKLLSAQDCYPSNTLEILIKDPESFTLLFTLFNQGSVYFEPADFD